jgi:hypothetical protein
MSVGHRLLVLLACALPSSALAYGEQDGEGVPSHEERLLHVLTNQARQDPHAWPGWDTSRATGEPRRALVADPGLFTAARFHADDMAENDFFAHESSDGTGAGTRIARYYVHPSGENLALLGPDAADAITAWLNSEQGHRENLLEPTWNQLGGGHAERGGQNYWVQDFGRNTRPPAVKLVAGSWRVRGGEVELLASWLDEEAPRSLSAAVADECLDMARIAGPAGNETRSAKTRLPSSCSPVVFVALDGEGDRHLYPSTGSLLLGSECEAEYDASLLPSACELGAGRGVIDAEAKGCRCARGTPNGLFAAFVLAILFVIRAAKSV